MNVTMTPHDGPRAISYALANNQATPVVVQAGRRVTLEVVQVHMGLKGDPEPFVDVNALVEATLFI